jgi:streptogramin lyase
MLNIARYSANNAQAILDFSLTPIPYTSQTASQQINAGVYVPYLTSFGTAGSGGAIDWSVAIYYLANYGVTSTGQGATYPSYVAVDANDNVYFSNPNASASTAGNVIALASNGKTLWTTDTDTKNLVSPRAIAADASGHIWIANGSATAAGAFVQEMDAATGSVIQRYSSSSNTLYGVAVDSLGNVWYGSNTTTGQNLHELVRNGTSYAEATFVVPPSSTLQLLQIRPDSSNNIWIAGYSSSSARAVYFPNTGTAAAPTYTAGLKFATPSGSAPYGIVSDASGNAYMATNGTGSGIYKTTVTGSGSSAVLNASSVATNQATASRFLDIDGVGSIWYLDNTSGTYLYQYAPSSRTTTSYYPCYNAGTMTGTGTSTSVVQVCSTGMSTKLDLAIDSTGSIWVASYGNSGGGRMVQIIGLAAPTVPLKALGKPGVMP